MGKEDKTGFYFVLIVAVVAIVGLLLTLLPGSLSLVSSSSVSSSSSSSDTVTGSTVSASSLVKKAAESSDAIKAKGDEFTVSTLTIPSLIQGAYYSVQVANNQLAVKNMKDPADFSLAYDAIKQGIANKNYGLVKTLKPSQLTVGNTYIVYYAGGDYFTFVELKS